MTQINIDFWRRTAWQAVQQNAADCFNSARRSAVAARPCVSLNLTIMLTILVCMLQSAIACVKRRAVSLPQQSLLSLLQKSPSVDIQMSCRRFCAYSLQRQSVVEFMKLSFKLYCLIVFLVNFIWHRDFLIIAPYKYSYLLTCNVFDLIVSP